MLHYFRTNTAHLEAPTITDVTSTSMRITGHIDWYKDGGSWGIAWKKSRLKNLVPQLDISDKDIDETPSSFYANTEYDVCFFVTYNGETQFGPVVKVKTLE